MKVKLIKFDEIILKNPYYEFNEYHTPMDAVLSKDLVVSNVTTHRSNIIEIKLGFERIKLAGGCSLSVQLIDLIKFQGEELFLLKQDAQTLKQQKEKLKSEIMVLENKTISEKFKEIFLLFVKNFKNLFKKAYPTN